MDVGTQLLCTILMIVVGVIFSNIEKQKKERRSYAATRPPAPPRPAFQWRIAGMYLALALVLLFGLSLTNSGLSLANAAAPVEPNYTLLDAVLPSPGRSANGQAFSAFPKALPRLISYDFGDAAGVMTEREQLNQVRDWLLYAILTDANLTSDELNRVLFDLPPVRYGYLEPVANFQYGDTRMAVLGDGQAVGLVPAGAFVPRNTILIADEIRKNTGVYPAILHLFEYTVDLSARTAQLTRGDELEQAYFTTPESGYVESIVTDYSGLVTFMERVQRLTSAQAVATGIKLTGRTLPGDDYLNISAEDVAALWQSQSTIDQEQRAFYADWYDDVDALNRSALALNSRIQVYILPGQLGNYSVLRTNTSSMMTQEVYEARYAELFARMEAARIEAGIVDASGFSLDQDFMYPELISVMTLISPVLKNLPPVPNLPDMTAVTNALAAGDAETFLLLIDVLRQNAALCPEANTYGLFASIAADSLAAGDLSSLEMALSTAGSEFNCDQFVLSRVLYETAFNYYRYQYARYDGELEGTEVGMVLFYCDLLAKLWGINFNYSNPGQEIADFISLPERQISPIFEPEEAVRSSTRLWFGYQHEGFQTANFDGAILFGDVATRIYAASSNPLYPGLESEPSARSASFLGWWDNHYAEVARFEPQYERLNEIMKWSLVFAWMSNNGTLNTTGFLADVSVERDNWFPEWAASNEDLRFRDWEQIAFYERGYRDLSVEALPLLTTPNPQDGSGYWVGGYWSGGVSLAEPYLFETLGSLPSISADDVLAPMLRSNVDWAAAYSADELTTLAGARYEFSVIDDLAQVEIVPPPAVRPRTALAETINTPIERVVASDITGLRANVRIGDVTVGELVVRPRANGFEIGYESLTVDRVSQLSRSLSETSPEGWAEVVRAYDDIQDAVRLEDDVLAVRFDGDSERWFEFKVETPSIDIQPDVYMRAANLDALQGIEVRVIGSEAQTVLRDGDLLFGSLDDIRSPVGSELPPPEHPLYQQITDGDVLGIADLLIADPARAASLTSYKHEALQWIDELVSHGEYARALDELDHLRTLYGDQRDLVVLDSILRYDVDALQSAADTINFSRLADEPRLVMTDELFTRIRAANNTAEQFSIGRIVQAASADVDGRLVMYVDGDALNVRLDTPTLPAGEAVSLSDIPPDAVVYLADDFNLSSADPALSMREALSPPILGEDVRILLLADSETGAIRPGRIFVEGDEQGFTRILLEEPAAHGSDSQIDLDFVEDLLEALTDSGGSTCPDGQQDANGQCQCPASTIWVGNSCQAVTDVYFILPAN